MVDPSSPLRTTQTVLYYPPSYDYAGSPQMGDPSTTGSIHTPSQEDHSITEPGITPMPTIDSAREEEVPAEEPPEEDVYQPILMEGVVV